MRYFWLESYNTENTYDQKTGAIGSRSVKIDLMSYKHFGANPSGLGGSVEYDSVQLGGYTDLYNSKLVFSDITFDMKFFVGYISSLDPLSASVSGLGTIGKEVYVTPEEAYENYEQFVSDLGVGRLRLYFSEYNEAKNGSALEKFIHPDGDEYFYRDVVVSSIEKGEISNDEHCLTAALTLKPMSAWHKWTNVLNLYSNTWTTIPVRNIYFNNTLAPVRMLIWIVGSKIKDDGIEIKIESPTQATRTLVIKSDALVKNSFLYINTDYDWFRIARVSVNAAQAFNIVSSIDDAVSSFDVDLLSAIAGGSNGYPRIDSRAINSIYLNDHNKRVNKGARPPAIGTDLAKVGSYTRGMSFSTASSNSANNYAMLVKMEVRKELITI